MKAAAIVITAAAAIVAGHLGLACLAWQRGLVATGIFLLIAVLLAPVLCAAAVHASLAWTRRRRQLRRHQLRLRRWRSARLITRTRNRRRRPVSPWPPSLAASLLRTRALTR